MGGLSIWHLLIILVILIVFFGPQRLEGLGSSLGKAIKGFKQGLEEGSESDKEKAAKAAEAKDSTKKDA